MEKNPFRKSQSPFPHESKSKEVIANEVAELEKIAEMEEVDPAAVLKEYKLESDIPINHAYWRSRK